MRKAFTLIELLVVIAIIAILAAILFPVFAQAKAAAKRTASLSNAKQMSVGTFLYSSANNDGFVPGDVWGFRSTDGGITSYGAIYRSWAMNVAPYIKNDDMFYDPLAGNKWNPDTVIPTAASYIKAAYSQKLTTWGYNSTWLDQAYYTNGAWSHKILSQGALGNPAQTVMITSKYSQVDESTLPYNSYYGYGSAGSLTTNGRVDPPICATIDQYCFDGWGTGGFYAATLLKDKYTSGAYSGGVAPRANDGAIVVFADGHASRLTMGALANGTNWTKTRAASAIAMVDETKYIWDDK